MGIMCHAILLETSVLKINILVLIQYM